MDVKCFIPDKYGYYIKSFNRLDYTGAFEDYSRKAEEGFAALEREDPAQAAEELIAYCDSLIRFPWRKGVMNFDFMCLFSLYTVPAALKRGGDGCREFAQTLCEKWNQSHPKQPFRCGDYETLVEGFRTKTIFGFKMGD